MSGPTFTRRTWFLEPWSLEGASGWGIAITGDQWINVDRVTEHSEANARLIAAAPDLYEALRDILPYARACIGATWLANPPHDSVIVAAEAALAKVDAC